MKDYLTLIKQIKQRSQIKQCTWLFCYFYQKILDLKITEDLNLTIIEEIALATIKANEELENMHGLDMFQRIITKKRCQLLKHRGKKEIPVKML